MNPVIVNPAIVIRGDYMQRTLMNLAIVIRGDYK